MKHYTDLWARCEELRPEGLSMEQIEIGETGEPAKTAWVLDYPEGYHDDADSEGDEWKRGAVPLDDRINDIGSLITESAASAIASRRVEDWLMERGWKVVMRPPIGGVYVFDAVKHETKIAKPANTPDEALCAVTQAVLDEEAKR